MCWCWCCCCRLHGVPIRRATQKSDSSRFRVSGFDRSWGTNFHCRFQSFGFRVSIGPGEVNGCLQSRFRVSGFGFRSVLGKLSLQSRFRVSGFGFRVSIGPGEVKSSESVSGFGFRVSGFGFRSVLGKVSLQSRFRVSGFGFRVSGFDRSWGS